MFITKQDLFRTEFYDGFMRPQDVHSLLNVYLLSDGQRGTRIAFGRSPRAGEWEQEQIEQLTLFAPHVYRAALINRQLEFSRLNAEGALAGPHRLAQGVIVVDAENQPIFVNQAAECILAKADGLVRDARGLATASRAETSRLQRMIAEAANGDLDTVSRSALNVTRPSQRGHYSLLVVPLRLTPGWFLPQRSGAIIFVRDPERAADAPPPDLRQLYGLTPTEAVLVMQIVRSGGLQAAAHNMKIALSTARTHLQRAFQKTGTHRQAELVRLVVEIQAGLRLHK